MFRMTNGKGFHMTFENGYTISVQCGPGNYCSSYDMEYKAMNIPISTTAEIAVWNNKRVPFTFPDGANVLGWQTTDDVLFWMNEISKL